MRISHKFGLVGISIPKSGSHTMFKLMEENFDAVSHGSFHEVVIPKSCYTYTAFAFVRNPYDRAASLYNMLADPGDGSDLMKLINHGFYKREVEDLKFETFCAWLGNCPEESMIYEASTSQYDYLETSNASPINIIKIDKDPLGEINRLFYRNDIPGIYEIPHELELEHESFEDLANEECIELINSWAHPDFWRYDYDKLGNKKAA